MNRTLTWFLLPLIMLAWVQTASAGPSSNRIKQGPSVLDELFGDSPEQSPSKQTGTTNENVPQNDLDGIWRDASGNIVLVKTIHRSIYISGNSNTSAWHAQCVPSEQAARCIGNGISETKGEFNYESELRTLSDSLEIGWRKHFSNGQNDAGKEVLLR